MTVGGWIVMLLSVSAVLSLSTYCLYRTLTVPEADIEEHLKRPLDIDTRDTEEAD
jgi:hypothetical protein